MWIICKSDLNFKIALVHYKDFQFNLVHQSLWDGAGLAALCCLVFSHELFKNKEFIYSYLQSNIFHVCRCGDPKQNVEPLLLVF